MAAPDQDPEVPLVDIGDGVMAPAFGVSPDVPPLEAGTEGSASLVETPATSADVQAAMLNTPDVAAYTLPSGEQVQRRSIDELIKLKRELQADEARRAGLRRTRAYFP